MFSVVTKPARTLLLILGMMVATICMAIYLSSSSEPNNNVLHLNMQSENDDAIMFDCKRVLPSFPFNGNQSGAFTLANMRLTDFVGKYH